ncbi:MAG: glycosyltransferase family 2 protein [Acidobacteriota bacterium]|nr:glycosyltransferase family 2 protein [Acidobacteriota bacterium]
MKHLLHSILVPVFRSRGSMEELVRRVAQTMREAGIEFELVLVDDGSPDDSFAEIRRLALRHPFIRGFRLSRNFGHQAALTVGLQQCRGDFVAIMDDDLQDPPEILPVFFSRLYQDADVVYGIRRQRKENLFKRAAFAIFYRLISALSRVRIPLDAGDFCALRRRVVDAMLQMYDANPFLRGTRAWVGFNQVGLEYERAERVCGKSGYSMTRYVRMAVTGIMMFSHVPLRLATISGLLISALSFGFGLSMFVKWLIKPFDVPGYLSTFIAITFLGGVQLISIGIIGHYLGYLIENNRRWPVAFIAEDTERSGENRQLDTGKA